MRASIYSNNYLIISLILILSGFGLIAMYSASSLYAMNQFNNYLHFFSRQIRWILLGIILMIALSNLNYKLLKELSFILLFFSWIILVAGYFLKGNNPASRWLVIGGKSWMTTSDFARISLIIFTANFIDKSKNYIKDWKNLLKNFTPFVCTSLILILFQPDTSTAMVIALIIMIMLFIAGANWKYLLGIMITGVTAIIYKILNTPYAYYRITNWNDDQKIQSLNALGTGGFWGTGLGNSIIKNGYLPEAHTDFILPIIGEEMGFIGILFLFTLFSILFKIGSNIIKEAPDLFSTFLSIGILTTIIIYFLINAAYVVGFAPTTGLPLPFISYGGSHTIFTLISMGILLNIAKRGKSEVYKKYRGLSYE
jgi:cell division protein FtsW